MAPTILEYSYTIITILFIVIALKISLNRKISLKKEMFTWGAFGFLFNLYSLSWLYTAYPLVWITPGALQMAGIFLLHIIVSFVAGLSFVIVGFGFKEKIKSIYKPFVFAFLLSLAEIMRSIFVSLLYSGNGGQVGLHWSAGTLGNALSTTPLIEYAYFGGVYTLTFILGLLIYICVSTKNIKLYWGYLLVVFLGLIFIHFFVPVNGPKHMIRVGVITTDFSVTSNDTDIKKYFTEQTKKVQNMTLQISTSSPDIIVYPEDTRYVEYISENQKNTLIKSLKKDALIVDGDAISFNGKISNYSVFYEPNTNKAYLRGKHFLFPFNEYVPTLFESIFKIFVKGTDLSEYNKKHTFIPQNFIGTYNYKGLSVGTLICSEILSFETINLLHNSKPDIVINQSYLNVFHNSPWFLMHDRSFSKVAAAQLRTPLIGVANGTQSYIISPYGQIEKTISKGFSTKIYSIQGGKIYTEK